MSRNFLVTGGAGFIGSNYVHRLLQRGESVTVFDNLARGGSQKNLLWLRETFGDKAFRLIVGDIRDTKATQEAADGADVILHLAAQVAVTTSVVNPREDFDTNALGTFNILEAARSNGRSPIVLYASTNKVYGGMQDVGVTEEELRYRYTDFPEGVPEGQPLDFHSPYGCSKGAGDQYMRDYQRIYGLPTVVLRQSCIYGPRQFGMEDQGWVAWFIIAADGGKPITIYGNGKQVRDILFVDDLLDMYDAAIEKINKSAGQVYNVGGGKMNTIAIWTEFAPYLETLTGRKISIQRAGWRPGDQRIFVSDIRKAENELGWKPAFGVEEGIRRLHQWVTENRALFA